MLEINGETIEMINKNEIIFKNHAVEEMLENQKKVAAMRNTFTPEVAARYFKSLSLQDIGKGIIGGYWYTLLCEVMMNALQPKAWIDFSYETIHNLPAVITVLYHFQKKNGYSDDRNIDVVAKTIGAVMYGLAMNEHGCDLAVIRGKGSPLWGDALNIFVEADKKTDFLKPALQTVKASPLLMGSGAYFEMTPVIDAYKDTIGVDLTDYKIGNIMISG